MGGHRIKELIKLQEWLRDNRKLGKTDYNNKFSIGNNKKGTSEYESEYEIDVIKISRNKRIYIDVVSCYEDWRTHIGKIAAYLSHGIEEKKKYGKEFEVWLVTDVMTCPQLRGKRYRKSEYHKCRKEYKQYFVRICNFLTKILRDDLKNRVYIKFYNPKVCNKLESIWP